MIYGFARCSTNKTKKDFQKPFDSGVIFPFTSGRPSKEFSRRCYKSDCIVPFTSGKDDIFFSEGYFTSDFCPSVYRDDPRLPSFPGMN